nr:MAG TPA: hypothetical protein [Crassvirales sp.]
MVSKSSFLYSNTKFRRRFSSLRCLILTNINRVNSCYV